MDKETIRAALSQHKKTAIALRPGLSPAGVLIPVFCDHQDCWVVVGKRSQEVKFHKGQFCFPGGAREEHDRNLVATALRESEEEIGLHPQDVDIVGELDDHITTSNYVVSPYVGYVPYPYTFTSDGHEILSIVTVPMTALRDRRNWREEIENVNGETHRILFLNYEGDIIWGATAWILQQFIEVVTAKSGASG